MRIQRLLLISAVAVLLAGAHGVAASGQDAPATRGTVKVRPRFFNPFDVGTSRLTLNPFGVFSFSQPASVSASVGTSSAVTSSDSKVDPVLTDGSLGVSTSSVRPPFRPPVRSPFRPPPRPPF